MLLISWVIYVQVLNDMAILNLLSIDVFRFILLSSKMHIKLTSHWTYSCNLMSSLQMGQDLFNVLQRLRKDRSNLHKLQAKIPLFRSHSNFLNELDGPLGTQVTPCFEYISLDFAQHLK